MPSSGALEGGCGKLSAEKVSRKRMRHGAH
jgi:hypothetical protein